MKMIFRSVYRMRYSLSMGARGRNQPGYLLIELMIALATLAVCSLLVAKLQAHMVCQCYEAEQYLKAVNYASRTIEKRLSGRQEQDGFTIETSARRVHENIPYNHVTVAVSWNNMAGVQKQITIQGGMLDESTRT